MFPVIVLVPSSNAINLFLYILLSLLNWLFIPAKTHPTQLEELPNNNICTLQQYNLQTLNVYGSIYFIEY